jgi:transporter family protein
MHSGQASYQYSTPSTSANHHFYNQKLCRHIYIYIHNIHNNKMGGQQSSMKRSESSAFGRLRIDSPRIVTPGSVKQSLQHRRKLRMAAEGQRMLLAPGTTTETSPLVQKPPAVADLTSNAFLGTTESPPIAVWIVPALCCAMAYALYNIFIKKGSSHINPVLGGVILQLVAALLGSALLAFLVVKEGGSEVIVFDGDGVFWAVLAGVAVGVAEIVSFFVSSLGVQAMQSIPVIIGGSVMFGTVLGALALHEDLSLRGWLGVVMISVGISLVGLDSEGDGH